MSMAALNLSIYIEIMTLKFPGHFLLLASIANVGKNICWLLASASRGSINMRFAKRNNMGDITGKSVSQFTTSSLIGMATGMALTSLINVSNIAHVMPVCAVLTTIGMGATFKSAAIIDEVYLNNTRANIILDHYFKSGNQTILNVEETNALEKFILPDFLNRQRCNYVRYGEREIQKVLTVECENNLTKSVWLQMEKPDRKFLYHVQILKGYKSNLSYFTSNSRPYIIHLNVHHLATDKDILESYYFARLLDF